MVKWNLAYAEGGCSMVTDHRKGPDWQKAAKKHPDLRMCQNYVYELTGSTRII